jgi:hypothetical protein
MIAGTVPTGPFPWKEADAMLSLLIRRAADLTHCRPGSLEEDEFTTLAKAIEAYESKRWPSAPKRRSRS